MPRKILDAQDAQSCLLAAEAAGLSPRDWARQHDLDARSLNLWRIHLARRASPSAPSVPPTKPRLVELVPAAPRSQARYVLHVAGATVELTDDFRDDSLARLVRVLRSC